MVLVAIVSWASVRSTPFAVDRAFRILQFASASLYSLGHGGNDAQKTMGIIAVLLYSQGYLGGEFSVPFWVVLACQAAMALGTLMGGWRIVRTMGLRITKLTPMQGFCAETGGAATLFMATFLGVPVSTTHTITGAIVGVGAARRVSAVRWNVASSIVYAWVITIPASADRRGAGLLGGVVAAIAVDPLTGVRLLRSYIGACRIPLIRPGFPAKRSTPMSDLAVTTKSPSRSPLASRSGAAAHLCDHLPSRRRQDHADRKAAAVRRRHQSRRPGQGQGRAAQHPFRLDEDRARARHLGRHLGDDLRVRGPRVQPAGHAGPRGLFRRHLPHADRGRFRRDGDRRRQGHRGADAQAVRGLPAARHSRSSPSSTRWTAKAATPSICWTRSKRRWRSTPRR